MAYIDAVKSGKKTFYYLGKTLRLGPKRWKKLRIKLGEKEPSREQIAKSLKALRLQEYDIYNEGYLDASKLEVIDDFKEVFNERIKKMPLTVREKEELSHGMIPGAKHIPLGGFEEALDLDAKTFLELYHFPKPKKEELLILYCRTGNRSEFATRIAISKGFNAKNYHGSIWEWSTIDKNVKRY